MRHFSVSRVPCWGEVSIFLVEPEVKESTAFKSWSYCRKSCVSLKCRIAFSSGRLWTWSTAGHGTVWEQQNLGFHAHSGPRVWGWGWGATERLAWSAPVLLPLAGHEIARGGHAAERNSLKTRLGCLRNSIEITQYPIQKWSLPHSFSTF